jgi:hypothetical protein
MGQRGTSSPRSRTRTKERVNRILLVMDGAIMEAQRAQRRHRHPWLVRKEGAAVASQSEEGLGRGWERRARCRLSLSIKQSFSRPPRVGVRTGGKGTFTARAPDSVYGFDGKRDAKERKASGAAGTGIVTASVTGPGTPGRNGINGTCGRWLGLSSNCIEIDLAALFHSVTRA